MVKFSIQFRSENWNIIRKADGDLFNLNGRVFQNNILLDATSFSTKVKNNNEISYLCDLLKSIGGFYAWVEQSSGTIRAAVDHVRSKPLFYASNGNNFYLSDKAEWVRRQVGDKKMDSVSKEEFLLAGYVTGSDTLYPNVKQLQAGEVLVASEKKGDLSVKKHRYYRFIHKQPEKFNELFLRNKLEKVAYNSIENLIQYAKNRQIVVPLSGGYDSRIIVLLLKKLGYENILTFTYGISDNYETKISKIVAEKLGLPWKFVEYTNIDLARAWSGNDAKDYRENASNHSSLPHVQDWYAVKKLVEKGDIEQDAVIVPGHTGDFISGGHIPHSVFSGRIFPANDLTNAIIDNHYSNMPKEELVTLDKASLTDRISDRIGLPFDGTATSFANSVEVWNWQERQAKYIVNSVRVYDHFNLDWWLPMWDLDFIKFWETVPLALRQNRRWFVKWIDEQSEEAGIVIRTENGNSVSNFKKIKKRIKPFYDKIPAPLINKIKKADRWVQCKFLNKGFENHFLAFDGLIPKSELDKYYISGYDFIGTFSDLYIKGKWGSSGRWK